MAAIIAMEAMNPDYRSLPCTFCEATGTDPASRQELVKFLPRLVHLDARGFGCGAGMRSGVMPMQYKHRCISLGVTMVGSFCSTSD